MKHCTIYNLKLRVKLHSKHAHKQYLNTESYQLLDYLNNTVTFVPCYYFHPRLYPTSQYGSKNVVMDETELFETQSVEPLHRKIILCFKELESERVSRIIWFRSGLQIERIVIRALTANLKVLGTYPNDNDELIIAKRGSMTSGSTSFSSLDGIGSNIHWFADLTSLYNSSSAPLEDNEWNCSSGDLQCTLWCDTVADGVQVVAMGLFMCPGGC